MFGNSGVFLELVVNASYTRTELEVWWERALSKNQVNSMKPPTRYQVLCVEDIDYLVQVQ